MHQEFIYISSSSKKCLLMLGPADCFVCSTNRY